MYRIVKRNVAESVPDRASVHTRNAAFEVVSAQEKCCSALLLKVEPGGGGGGGGLFRNIRSEYASDFYYDWKSTFKTSLENNYSWINCNISICFPLWGNMMILSK